MKTRIKNNNLLNFEVYS